MPPALLPPFSPQRLAIAPQAFLARSLTSLPPLAIRTLSLDSLALDQGAALALLALAFGAFALELLDQRAPPRSKPAKLGHRSRPAGLALGRFVELDQWLGLHRGCRGGASRGRAAPSLGDQGRALAAVAFLSCLPLSLPAGALLAGPPLRLLARAAVVVAGSRPGVEGMGAELGIEVVVAGGSPQIAGLDSGIERQARSLTGLRLTIDNAIVPCAPHAA